ncbi:MAG: hypothetical protein JWN04_6202 [Myxococcaceae bacterium]|nr:hypothetical protein [Myxococcaceae bacterium]
MSAAIFPRAWHVAALALAGALAACSLAACSSDADPGADFPELNDLTSAPAVIRRAAQAVVRVGTATESGTGAFISPTGRMMTNNHVLGATVCPREGCWISLALQHQRGEPVQAPETVFAVPEHVDVGLDMAVVQIYDQPPVSGGTKLATPSFLTFESVDAPSLVGQHVTIVGHPQARLKKWSDGVVIDATGAWFTCTNYILPGDSGSPVLNDAGNIVGLIHRGTANVSELTSVGVNLTALGTASASLVQALEAPLPAVLLSTAASYSADYVLANNAAFLNARTHTAVVDGVATEILSLLADACDEGLARQDYASPEELSAGLGPCSDSQSWIECRSEEIAGALGAVCPSDDAARAAWAARYQAMNRRSVELNGQLSLGPITFGTEALQANDAAGQSVARANLIQALDETKPLHDFNLARYLAAFRVDLVDTARLIDEYTKVPHYELYASQIANSALWLNFESALSSANTRRILRELESDRNVSTGVKLYIEDVRYNSGDL